jgi:hypothetical protein
MGPRAGLAAVKKRTSPAAAGNGTPAIQPVARPYTHSASMKILMPLQVKITVGGS